MKNKALVPLGLLLSLLMACDEPEQKEDNSIKDIDGNVYTSVVIGEQEWMVENLTVTHYRDGTEIPYLVADALWRSTDDGAYCYYDNHSSNGDTYGALYNGYALLDSRNIAPEGWHVPTDAEWEELEMYLGMSKGSKLAGNADLWVNGELKNDSEFGKSGFTALPSGWRKARSEYEDMAVFSFFWTASEQGTSEMWYRRLYNDEPGIRRGDSYKRSGFSVRLLRD